MGLAPASPDLGSFVFFEHINMQVTDHRLATLFNVEGLGLTRDPYRNVGVRNMWVNVGTQQFHLPIGPAPRLAGEVGVAVPDLDTLVAQLEAVRESLTGTAFSFQRVKENGNGHGRGTLRVTDPWVHLYRVHRAGAGSPAPPGSARSRPFALDARES